MVDLVVRRLTYKFANKTVIIYPLRGLKDFYSIPIKFTQSSLKGQ